MHYGAGQQRRLASPATLFNATTAPCAASKQVLQGREDLELPLVQELRAHIDAGDAVAARVVLDGFGTRELDRDKQALADALRAECAGQRA